MTQQLGDVEYNPADPRNGVLKDLWSQVQMMRIHRELTLFIEVLPDEYQDSELELSLKETAIRLQRKLLPEFSHNPLLGYTPGTAEWDKVMKSIHFQYMQL
jgi:hypothetical protein